MVIKMCVKFGYSNENQYVQFGFNFSISKSSIKFEFEIYNLKIGWFQA